VAELNPSNYQFVMLSAYPGVTVRLIPDAIVNHLMITFEGGETIDDTMVQAKILLSIVVHGSG
jgi:hypothetical protein